MSDVQFARLATTTSQFIAPPEPGLTPEEMLRRAKAMRPTLRANQAEVEAAGNISAATAQAMIDAGFYRVVQPRAFGGYGFDMQTFMKLILEVSRGCPDTGWVLSLVLGHVHQLAGYSLEAQREAYGETGDFRGPEVAAPQGQGVAVPGGYLVSGAWDYASGCAHATHILLTFNVPGRPPGEGALRMGLFDRKDYVIENNWHVFAMQGTGSDRVVLKDVFVPDYRTKSYPPLERNLVEEVYFDAPLFYGPARPFIVSESAAVVVGAALGALDLYEESFISRQATVATGAARRDQPEYLLNFGRARALADTARAALLQTAADYMEVARKTAETGETCSDDTARRLTLVLLQSIELAHQAVDIVFRTAGSSATKSGAMLGRYWRNVGSLRGHLAHQCDSAAINYGRIHFGHAPVGIS